MNRIAPVVIYGVIAIVIWLVCLSFYHDAQWKETCESSGGMVVTEDMMYIISKTHDVRNTYGELACMVKK